MHGPIMLTYGYNSIEHYALKLKKNAIPKVYLIISKAEINVY